MSRNPLVHADRWDLEAFDQACLENHRLADAVDALWRDCDYAYDMLAAVFLLLWQRDPQVIREVDGHLTVGLQVIRTLLDLPELQEIRPLTTHEEDLAGEVLVDLSEPIRMALHDPERLDVAGVGIAVGATLTASAEAQARFNASVSQWGMSVEAARRLPSVDRATLLAALARSGLAEHLDLVGRLREGMDSDREEEHHHSNLPEVGQSDIIGAMLPREHALRRLARLDFLARLASGELTTWTWDGDSSKRSGPVILVLDESASMDHFCSIVEGHPRTRIQWAKAIVIAVAAQLLQQGRSLVVLCFASHGQLRRHDASNPLDLAMAIDGFFGGDTDLEGAMEAALDELHEERQADILVVSDFTMTLDSTWTLGVRARLVQAEARVFGIAVGVESPALTDLCDDTVTITQMVGPDMLGALLLANT